MDIVGPNTLGTMRGKLVGSKLISRKRYMDTELFCFEFLKEMPSSLPSETSLPVHLFLHAQCRFEILYRGSYQNAERIEITGESNTSVFLNATKGLLETSVLRVEVSAKNDLWLDFGDYWVVFATCDDGEESWRFLIPSICQTHMVASNLSIQLE